MNEAVDLLVHKEEGVYLDATAGSGGHSSEILKRAKRSQVIAVDRDPEAIELLRKRFEKEGRILVVNASFSDLEEIVRSLGIEGVDGVLMDLGVSMRQLRNEERGFSFYSKAPLDMRMDRRQKLTAYEIVNRYSERDLERIIKQYGEEPKARTIAKAIVQKRKVSPITTCEELARLVEKVYGKRGRIHPATRVFQALRIAVNRELDELKEGLQSAYRVLNTDGRICVISYHSLEDRIVKRFFMDMEKKGLMKRLTKKPIVPTSEEIRKNPSSRSAKLRAGVKI